MNRFYHWLSTSLDGKAGIKEIWEIAYPLIVSTASGTVMMFADRFFLSNYSKEALAASMPAGFTTFMCVSFFFGITGYVNSMVAQHYGADKHDKCGVIAWQGLYVSLIGYVLLLLAAPLVAGLFKWVGHAPEIILLEQKYFRILMVGTVFLLFSNTVSSFFSGIGYSRIVMLSNVSGMLLNIPLSYGLIFGMEPLGIPSLGIAGAGYGTILSQAVILAILLKEFFRHRYAVYRTRTGFLLNGSLFTQLIRFGVPSGVELSLSIAAFNLFLLVIGSLGTNELAAVNLTLSWDLIAFLPQVGLGIAVASVTGKYVGAKDYVAAKRTPYSGLKMSFAYAMIFIFLFLTIPSFLVGLFGMAGDAGDFVQVKSLAIVLLRLAGLYVLADATHIIFGGALRGAGDTRFLMWNAIVLHWCVLTIPGVILIKTQVINVVGAWIWLIFFLIVMSGVMILRFRGDRWSAIKVISDNYEKR